MRHMIPLLVCSFILVNAVSGYLNAGPLVANAETLKSEIKKPQEQWQTLRVSKSLSHDDRAD